VKVPANHPRLRSLLAALALRLQVLRDRLTTPKGKILIRVIQASLRQHLVTVTAGKEVLARNLAFGQLTNYRVASPGTWTFRAVGGRTAPPRRSSSRRTAFTRSSSSTTPVT